VPPSAIEPSIGGRSHPDVGVDPTDDEVVEVTLNVPPVVLTKRKHDEGVRVSGRKKLNAPFSLRAFKQKIGLMFGLHHLSFASSQDPSLVSLTVQSTVIVVVVSSSLTPPSLPTQEVSAFPSTVAAVSVPLVALTTTPPSPIVMPLLSVRMATTSVSTDLPSSSSAQPMPALIVHLSTMPAYFSCPSVSLDHVYTS